MQLSEIGPHMTLFTTENETEHLVYVHSNLKLLQKLQSLDYHEANVEWERWSVSDSDSSEEKQ